MRLTPDRRVGKRATNRLRYGTANNDPLGRSSTGTVFVRVNRRPYTAEFGRLIPWYVKVLLRVYCTRHTLPNATEHGRVTDGSPSNGISRTYSYVSLVHENTPLWDMRDKQYHDRDVQRTFVDPCTIGSTSFSALSNVIRLQWTRLNIGRPGRP
jgi:hypothetical protein